MTEIEHETEKKKVGVFKEMIRDFKAQRLRNREKLRRWLSMLWKKPVSWVVAAAIWLTDHLFMSDPDVPKALKLEEVQTKRVLKVKPKPPPTPKPKIPRSCSIHGRYTEIPP